MIRRDFITLLGGAAAWPVAARGQQAARVRRIGVLISRASDDAEGQARLAAFLQGLKQLGWSDGRNVRIDTRWHTDIARAVKLAKELVGEAPDVILASASTSAVALRQATRTIPIVFAMVIDPVGGGIVESMAQPGGNITGFMQFEYSLSGKWIELLKQIAPSVTRVTVIRDPVNPTGTGQFAVMQAVAPSLGIELRPVDARDSNEIKRATAALSPAHDGLVVTAGRATDHRALIVDLAARNRLPAVYPYRFFVEEGGLISYGPDLLDQHRRAATYVDRILKGEKPADLPVQAPTKYETVLNLRTANALGLDLPPSVLARADEVIE
jgi:putative ABC transport system substrate-binding protein